MALFFLCEKRPKYFFLSRQMSLKSGDLGGGGQQFVDQVHVGDHVFLIGFQVEELDKLLSFIGL